MLRAPVTGRSGGSGGRGPARIACRVVVAALAALLLLQAASAGDEPITVEEMRKRRSALRSAAGRYITHRKRFPSRCPVCNGAGKMRVRRRGIVDCKQCVGKGVWLSKDDYREVYYEMRTPGFRMLPDIKDVLGKQYDQARRGQPWPLHIQRYRIKDWEMVDPTHGIAWFLLNASKVPTATYWILAPDEDGRRLEWYLYDARSDGPWPSRGERYTPAGGGGTSPPEGDAPLDPERGRLARAVVARARITFRPADASERSAVLHLTLEPGTDGEGRPTYDRIALDAVRLLRSALAADTPWQRVEAEWRDHWSDPFGRIALRPRWLCALDRVTAETTAWDTLGLAEQVRRVALTELTHEGWSPVQARTPAPTPPSEPEPPTPPEEPVEPGPGPEAPEEPAQPTPPTPPAPPPPTAPASGDLPPLTAKAKRAAEKGLERIRELVEAAKSAFNDGVQAHQGGAMDLWQEKLSEAGAHLGEIKDVWYEEIVPAMPGADEAEQDAVANEHFGEVWDDVSKLESMVRKLSRL